LLVFGPRFADYLLVSLCSTGDLFRMPPFIPEADARAMVRLVGEVVALNTDHASAKNYLMNGLAKMIGADCWVWMLSYLHPDKPPVYASCQHEGFSNDRFARYLQAIEHPDMQALTAPFAVPRHEPAWEKCQV
jgi:hypothetical protein